MKTCFVIHKYGIPIEDPCVYPLGPMYISAALKDQGHEVKVLNYNLFEYDFLKEIQDQDAVLFTGFEEFKPLIIRDAERCSSLGIHTVLGGALATFFPTEMIKYVDTVVVGEGEGVVGESLTKSGILIGYPPDLSLIPLPDYEGFGISEHHLRHTKRYMGVLTSRGCPFRCTFCSQTCKFQMRDLSSVLEEVDKYIADYQVELIIFNDNTLNINKNRFMRICSEMNKRNIGWGASLRADLFDDEMAFASKNSGCQYVIVGIESFRQDRLNYLQKDITVEQITNTLDLLHKYDIDYHGNVLVGFNDQPLQDINYELSLIPDKYKAMPCLVYPFAGTGEGVKRGITKEQVRGYEGVFKEYIESKGKYMYPVGAMA